MIPISICVIAKNEEKHMENFLSSIQKHFNGYPYEIVIVDTGSTDKTVEIARKYTNNVSYFEWTNDFSAARNYSIQKASHNWILVLDCDEYVTELDFVSLQAMIEEHPKCIGNILCRSHCTMSVSKQKNIQTDSLARFFNRNFFHFESIIHEQVMPIRPSLDRRYVNIGLTVEHYGYSGTPEEMDQKADRNISLLLEALKKQPDNAYLCFQLGTTYRTIEQLDKACEYFELGLSLQPDPRSPYVLDMIIKYGYCLMELDQPQKTLEFIELYDIYSYSAEYVYFVANIYYENRMYLQALTEFLKLTTYENPKTYGLNTFMAYYNMGYINELLGEKEAAVALYNKCGDYPPALTRLKSLKKG